MDNLLRKIIKKIIKDYQLLKDYESFFLPFNVSNLCRKIP